MRGRKAPEPEAEAGGFSDRLAAAIEKKKSCLVVGLDPDLSRLPGELASRVEGAAANAGWNVRAGAAVGAFLRDVVEAVAEEAVAVKPNTAFFERLGPVGWECLIDVSRHARARGLLVITDAKRGDVGHTAEAYAEALLGERPDTVGAHTDAVTLNPYLGEDGIRPFLEQCRRGSKGAFVLVRTSNPSAAEIQDLAAGGRPLHERVAQKVGEWGRDLEGAGGLSSLGAVVGATAPGPARRVREILPKAFLLVPGVGAQGGSPEALRHLFLPGGRGVVVNASRSVLYPSVRDEETDWRAAVRRAAGETRERLERVRSGR